VEARHSESSIQRKSKVSDPHAYRGIGLECTAFKLLSSILKKRLYMMAENALQDEKFGFSKRKIDPRSGELSERRYRKGAKTPKGQIT
jgi:hypothetical protein